MRIRCPGCGRDIPAEDISVDTGLAKCECGEVFSITVPPQAAEITPGKPLDTPVEIEKDPAGEMHVRIPPAGFKRADHSLLFFTVVWNCFMGVFNFVMSAHKSLYVFFLLSLFNLVGLALIFTTLNMLFGESSIRINSLGLVIVKKLFGIKRKKVIPLEGVYSIDAKLKTGGTSTEASTARRRLSLEINYAARSIEVGSYLSEAELKWLAWEIRKFVGKLRGAEIR